VSQYKFLITILTELQVTHLKKTLF